MRKKVIAGNWKMNNNISESQFLINQLIQGLEGYAESCKIIICPPYTSLAEAAGLLEKSNSMIKLGAQNLYFEDSGAFTGEISANMLTNCGCEYVLVGHSERRSIFNETDEIINKKLKKALSSGLKPIFCVGETLEDREKDITEEIISRQVNNGLNDINEEDFRAIIIAYEPVWAIGTGKTATPKQAQEVHEYIRSLINKKYSDNAAADVIIQYGGSVKPDNAVELLHQKDIDGALVGGACLKAESFIAIINAIK